MYKTVAMAKLIKPKPKIYLPKSGLNKYNKILAATIIAEYLNA
jgi:hypothetical protein